ncbi:MAG: hypothetical protein ACTHPS_00320 [Streptosporangiaceae bacterium]
MPPPATRPAAFRGSPGWPGGPPELEAKAAGLLGAAAARGLVATGAALGADKVFDPGLVATPARAGSP